MRGKAIGAFEIGRELGSGGMGTVHRAVVLPNALGIPAGRTVAVKLIHDHLLDAGEPVQRFLRDVRLNRYENGEGDGAPPLGA